MRHRTVHPFWRLYDALPEDVRLTADKNFALLKTDSTHHSLWFKKVNDIWSVRIDSDYRALAYEEEDDLVWYWIGAHDEYKRQIRRR